MLPRIIIAGTNSGVGKTTISMGLMAALSKKMEIQPYKVGPDYIDSAYHTFITNNKCRNLDSWMLSDDVIKHLFIKSAEKCDMSVIEGVMGLYDGLETGSDVGSTSRIAKILKAPVILIVDGKGVSQSLAATVKGFLEFDKNINIMGVIINNVGSEEHYKLLKEAIEYYNDIKCYGYLLKNNNIKLPERHLGLVPSCEIDQLKGVFNSLAEMIERTIDIEGLIRIGKNCDVLVDSYQGIPKVNEKVKIGLAEDKAFNFYYQDSIELLRNMGAEIINFSPIYDKELPADINGVILGGGFPEVFAKELEENISMKESIKKVLQKGLPYLAECGGMMYLCDEITDIDNNTYKMVGWLDGTSKMTQRLQRFGYSEVFLKEECILGAEGNSIKVHEFHRSMVEVKNKNIYQLKKVKRGNVTKQWECGYKKGNGIAAYAHMHFYSNISFAENFITACKNYKRVSEHGNV